VTWPAYLRSGSQAIERTALVELTAFGSNSAMCLVLYRQLNPSARMTVSEYAFLISGIILPGIDRFGITTFGTTY
jgi:hypothetical protein